MVIIDEKTAIDESNKYFDEDSLAGSTWINKYALTDENGRLLESTPKDMHDRIIKEVMRIERSYGNEKLTEELLKEMFYHFKYIVLGGSSMSGIGNKYKHSSLSNCFVIDDPKDSYGGICKTDQELVQLMKRRGGVGLDLSRLRPEGTRVTNDAKTSSGVVSFMERFSNSTREVSQNGRRGALMLSIDVTHPDAESFIDSKLVMGKITGANISVKITDKFMDAVKLGGKFLQRFPINATDDDLGISGQYLDGYPEEYKDYEENKLYFGKVQGTYFKVVNAKRLWDKIILNAWKSAEPGVLFFDTIKKESPADLYPDYQTVSTNPCGEIPLNPNDSCRLISINLKSVVKNPYTEGAYVDFELLSKVAATAQRIMDNVIDLEAEHIQGILDKIKSDPEDEDTKKVEEDLWKKILNKAIGGRRTGVGITGLGDLLAEMGIEYGSEESISLAESIQKTIAISCYTESILMAKDRGPFKDYNKEIELTFKKGEGLFLDRIMKHLPNDILDIWKEYGRRNIACLTIAPTGTVSLMTQTTSGIEPAFSMWYWRRKKTTDKSKAVFTDSVGDMYEEFLVVHKGLVDWYYVNNNNLSYEDCKKYIYGLDDKGLTELYEKSPYYKSTAQDINWVNKVKIQGAMQKWIDHSISCTVNVPENTTVDTVSKIYMTGYETGCKGLTIYRDKSRDGVLITTPVKKELDPNRPRPESLRAKVWRFKNGNDRWIAFIGYLDNNPFECFLGKVDDNFSFLPKQVTEGEIRKIKTNEGGERGRRYDFFYKTKYGHENVFEAINEKFDREFWNYARMISWMLRSGMPINYIVEGIDKLSDDTGIGMNTWKKGVKRALSKNIADGVKSKSKCPNCGADMVYQGGCEQCPSCGNSRCE